MNAADYGAILEAEDIISAAKDILAELDSFIIQARAIEQTALLAQKSLQKMYPSADIPEIANAFEQSRFQGNLRHIYRSLLHIKSLVRADYIRLTWTCRLHSNGLWN